MKKQENKSEEQMMISSKQFIFDFSILCGPISNKRGHFDDPFQVKRKLKNKKTYISYLLATAFFGTISYIGSGLSQLFSSSVNYFDAKIKTQMIVNSAEELKKHGLDYSPRALVQYGIIPAKKENCHNDPDEENRLWAILKNITACFKLSVQIKLASIY